MTENKEMHSLVVADTVGWVNLVLEHCVLIDLKSVCNSTCASTFDEAFFKDQRCISLHILCTTLLFAKLIYHNIELFYRLKLWAIKLHMHLNDVSRFLGNDVIKLSSKIFRWKAKVLGEDDMPKDVFSIVALDPVLILTSKVLINSSWLEINNHENVIVHFK